MSALICATNGVERVVSGDQRDRLTDQGLETEHLKPSADGDKNGKVSVWEAFSYATAGVRKWFDERGQLPTERPLLDDTGDGVCREADDPKGTDGAIASVTYLQPDIATGAPVDSELAALLRRRADLQGQIDLLRARKPEVPDDRYQSELERLLLELARLDRDIRTKQWVVDWCSQKHYSYW